MKTALILAFAATGLLVAASAQAAELDATWSWTIDGAQRIAATWVQDTNPAPVSSSAGFVTFIRVSDSKAGCCGVPIVGEVAFANANYQPGGVPLSFWPFGTKYAMEGPQIYSGTESAPVFAPGVWDGAVVTPATQGTGISYPSELILKSVSGLSVPEPSTWSMMLAGFAGLGGLYTANRHRPRAA